MIILPPNASQTNVMESPVRYGPTKVVLLVPVSSNITTGLGGTEILNEYLISFQKELIIKYYDNLNISALIAYLSLISSQWCFLLVLL